jgi:HK97 gp10 family phage protein
MKIKVVIPKFHAHLNDLAIRQFLRDAGNKTKQIMVQQAAAPKSGRTYHIGGGRTYTASAPGEYPANKFVRLSKSYRVEVGHDFAEIGTDVYYARFLRGGTRKMKPRKFLREALETVLENEHMIKPFVEWRRG